MTDEHPDLRFTRSTLADTSAGTMQNEAAAIFALFLRREAEFGVHPSVAIHYPDIADRTDHGFIGDAARHVATRADALAAEGRAADMRLKRPYDAIERPVRSTRPNPLSANASRALRRYGIRHCE